MTPITFKEAGWSGGPITIIAERIVSWKEREGSYGRATEITLDTGKTVLVASLQQDVEKKFKEALNQPA